jgi:hypothetical protein
VEPGGAGSPVAPRWEQRAHQRSAGQALWRRGPSLVACLPLSKNAPGPWGVGLALVSPPLCCALCWALPPGIRPVYRSRSSQEIRPPKTGYFGHCPRRYSAELGLVFFCAAGLVLINSISTEVLFVVVAASGVVGLRWQQGTPMGWRWVADHFFVTYLTPRGMIAPWHHQWQHLRPLHALGGGRPGAELWLKRCYSAHAGGII